MEQQCVSLFREGILQGPGHGGLGSRLEGSAKMWSFFQRVSLFLTGPRILSQA